MPLSSVSSRGALCAAVFAGLFFVASGGPSLAEDRPRFDFSPRPGPIVAEPQGAIADLGYVPVWMLRLADRNNDYVLNEQEQQRLRRRIQRQERCQDSRFFGC